MTRARTGPVGVRILTERFKIELNRSLLALADAVDIFALPGNISLEVAHFRAIETIRAICVFRAVPSAEAAF